MSNVNEILVQELDFNDIKDHFNEHHKKYAALAAALAATAGAHYGLKKYKSYKFKNSILGHLKNNREIYGGATVGALASLASSKNQPFFDKLKSATVSSMGGALTGSLLKNMRDQHEYNLKSNK